MFLAPHFETSVSPTTESSTAVPDIDIHLYILNFYELQINWSSYNHINACNKYTKDSQFSRHNLDIPGQVGQVKDS